MSSRPRVFIVGALVVTAAACGKKGAPLPPLRPVPAVVTALGARRVDDRVVLQFVLPDKNADNTSPVLIDRVEVYAMSVAPGATPPSRTELLLDKHLIGKIAVRPPESPDQTSGKTPVTDARPGPGDTALFTEVLSPTTLLTTPVEPAQKNSAAKGPAAKGPAAKNPVAKNPVAQEPAATDPAATSPAPADPKRVYLLVGASGKHKGPPAGPFTVRFGAMPATPGVVKFDFTHTTVTLTWTGEADQSFRVYAVDRDGKETAAGLLTAAPLTVATFTAPVTFDVEQCFAVRALSVDGAVSTESAASTMCKTPVDTFPPPAPANVTGQADAGVVNLTWDPVDWPDLAGYIVLRGEGTNGTLQPLMTTPTATTRWDDTTVRAGVQYEYAVVAVDKSTPPNRSAESNHVAIIAKAPGRLSARGAREQDRY